MKPPKVVKSSRGAAGKDCEDNASAASEEYVLGQVVKSLFQNKSTTYSETPLAHLFSDPVCEMQPVFITVPKESKKRKQTEEVESAIEAQTSSIKKEPLKKLKKTEKDISQSEKRLVNRECALNQADEEEEVKEIRIKQKLKNRKSQAASKSLAKAGGDGINQTKKKSQINQAEEMLKNKRTVFVGNLPINCTVQIPADDTLSKKLAAIKRKVHPNMKYINAFVVFKEENAAAQALKRNGTQIASGFHIRVDLASKSSSHDNKRSVFVGNLPYDIEDDAMRDHFYACGNVVGVRIVRDKNSGIGKGFGYILFEDTDAVHLALKLNNSELKGRKLRVKRCVEKEKVQQNPDKTEKNSLESKHRFGSSLKNTNRYSSNSFAGEKATPGKNSNKTRRSKIVSRKKAGKHK
uniref:RNA binding motif protein 34 n=1 Tax=Sphenodon punctatus TaxID=8508 RepID=A0A8D0HGB4_SPHPU